MKKETKITRRNAPIKNKGFGILDGLIICPECGGTMTVNHRKAKGHLYRSYRCFRCRGNRTVKQIRCEKIEAAVFDFVRGLLTDSGIKDLINRYETCITEKKERISHINKDFSVQLTEIERKISNVTNAIADMGLSPELETKLRDLRQKKLEIENLMNESDIQIPDHDRLVKNTEEICAEILAVLNDPNSPLTVINDALKLIIAQIIPASETSARLFYSLPTEVVKLSLRPRRSSNPQPFAPQANALSN